MQCLHFKNGFSAVELALVTAITGFVGIGTVAGFNKYSKWKSDAADQDKALSQVFEALDSVEAEFKSRLQDAFSEEDPYASFDTKCDEKNRPCKKFFVTSVDGASQTLNTIGYQTECVAVDPDSRLQTIIANDPDYPCKSESKIPVVQKKTRSRSLSQPSHTPTVHLETLPKDYDVANGFGARTMWIVVNPIFPLPDSSGAGTFLWGTLENLRVAPEDLGIKGVPVAWQEANPNYPTGLHITVSSHRIEQNGKVSKVSQSRFIPVPQRASGRARFIRGIPRNFRKTGQPVYTSDGVKKTKTLLGKEKWRDKSREKRNSTDVDVAEVSSEATAIAPE